MSLGKSSSNRQPLSGEQEASIQAFRSQLEQFPRWHNLTHEEFCQQFSRFREEVAAAGYPLLHLEAAFRLPDDHPLKLPRLKPLLFLFDAWRAEQQWPELVRPGGGWPAAIKAIGLDWKAIGEMRASRSVQQLASTGSGATVCRGPELW